MTVVFGLLGLQVLAHGRPTRWNSDYLSHKTTIQINGIFVLLVFLSHFCQYLTVPLPYSEGYYVIRKMLSQLVVTTFLFYSGYGVMYCLERQKERYLEKIPKKICEMIVLFSLAVAMYVVIQHFLGKSYSISHILYACIGWESVGNSNWYLFVILLLYAMTYACFQIFKEKKYALFAMVVLSLFAMVWLQESRSGTRWYNTFLCYPAGMIFCASQERVDRFVKGSSFRSGAILLLLATGFVVCYRLRKSMVFYEAHAILFALLVTWVMMKWKLDDPFLLWVGERIFGIYILQRIPMIVGKTFGLPAYPILYFCVCLIGVAVLAEIFQRMTRKVRTLL